MPLNTTFYTAGSSPALEYAVAVLRKSGYRFCPDPRDEVTHLLLPVPSFEQDGCVKGGPPLEQILQRLPPEVIVVGGNLTHPALQGRRTIDLLQDPFYLAQNAAITAHCTLKLLYAKLPVMLSGQEILVIGWGRIGKCLAQLLQKLDARVTIAARKETDRAMAAALGFGTVDSTALPPLETYRVIINTVPAPMVSTGQADPESLKIDLASRQGISGGDVIWARGLPGKDMPESSGALIAQSVQRLLS